MLEIGRSISYEREWSKCSEVEKETEGRDSRNNSVYGCLEAEGDTCCAAKPVRFGINVAEGRKKDNPEIIEHQIGRDFKDHLAQPFLEKTCL